MACIAPGVMALIGLWLLYCVGSVWAAPHSPGLAVLQVPGFTAPVLLEEQVCAAGFKERHVESGLVQSAELEKSQVLEVVDSMQPLRAASQAASHPNDIRDSARIYVYTLGASRHWCCTKDFGALKALAPAQVICSMWQPMCQVM